LAPPEQSLFARLAVFAGGCTFDAAEAICNAAGGLPIDLFDGFESLVQKSLLRQHEDPTGDVRFVMLETIREFAQERLQESPEAIAVREVHADMFLTLAESANWDGWGGQPELLDRLEADYPNLRQALAFFESIGSAGAAQRVRLAVALRSFWLLRGHFAEGRRVLESILDASSELRPIDRARTLAGAASLAESDWELERARELHEQALALFRSEGDAAGVAQSLTGLGVIARHDGDLDRARALHQEALDVWRATGDDAGSAGAILDLGVVSHLRGDPIHANRLFKESLELFTRLHDVLGEASTHQWLGISSLTSGQVQAAADHFGQSLERWRRLGNAQMTAIDLANLGEARHLAGAHDEAESLYREALQIYESAGDPMGRGFTLSQLGRLELDRQDCAKAVALLRQGLALRWEAGDRGGAADSLDALAEATLDMGDREQAAKIVIAVERLRLETGIARPSVYEPHFEEVRAAIGQLLPDVYPDVTATTLVGELIAPPPSWCQPMSESSQPRPGRR
jgi:tetratricopeptide (TPR) repeat protein